MFRLRDVVRITGGKPQSIELDREIKYFCEDSRNVKNESIFICIKGEKFDGAEFAEEAIKKGAVAVLAPFSAPIPKNIPAIYVDDVFLALGRLAREKLKALNTKIVGITGSVGKTTTKELTYTMLSIKYKVYKSKKSFNNHIGLPLTILEAPEHIDYLVLEYGTNHPGEIRYLTSIARPHFPIITKIGTAHIEFFETKESIAREKGTLLKEMDLDGTAFINAETECFEILNSMVPYTVNKISFGVNSGDIRPEKYEFDESGTRFKYKGIEFFFPLPGMGMLQNIMGSLALAEYLKIPLDDINKVIREFRNEKMRMERTTIKGINIVNDAYNSNPDSLSELLRTFKEGEGRLIFVLGDMLELGDKAEEEHRRMGKLFVELGHKVLITVGDLSRFVSEEARKMGLSETFHFNNKTDTVEFLKNYLKSGDTLILKASRRMMLEEIVKKLEELL